MKSELRGTLGIILKSRDWHLSGRDINILQMIALGYTIKNIAFSYSISTHTLKKYKARIFNVIGAENTAHAVAIAMRAGLIT